MDNEQQRVRKLINLSIEDIFHQYIDTKTNLQPRTIRDYTQIFGWFYDWWKKQEYGNHVLDIDPEFINEYAMYLRNTRKCSIATVNLRFRYLKAFFDYVHKYIDRRIKKLIHQEKIQRAPWWEHPCSLLELDTDKRQIPHLSREQVDKLLNIPNTTKYNGFRDYTMIRFLVDTGLRINECVNLRLSMFDFENRTVSLPGVVEIEENGRIVQRNYTKTGKPRTVVFSNITKEYLTRLIKWTSSFIKEYDTVEGYIFVGIFSKRVEGQPQPVSKTEFGRRLKQYGQIAGIKQKCTPHVLRHTTATLLAEAGADAFYIQKYMGHASIKTTQRYVTMSEKHVVEKYDLFKILD